MGGPGEAAQRCSFKKISTLLSTLAIITRLPETRASSLSMGTASKSSMPSILMERLSLLQTLSSMLRQGKSILSKEKQAVQKVLNAMSASSFSIKETIA